MLAQLQTTEHQAALQQHAAPTPFTCQGKYNGGRKNGEGCYCFTNNDVYEGEFRDDRMAGVGVYSFSPEGR